MPEDRYDLDRREVVPFVPVGVGRLLDVGCSSGRFGALLAERDPDLELWGIDPALVTGAGALGAYARTIDGSFPEDLPDGRFDCVVFNDVLEHVVDPWALLGGWPRWLAADGVVVASIPNVRHLTVLYRLAVKGWWRYEDTGLLDRTHLRFFTRTSIVELFEGAGLRIERLEPLNLPRRGPLGRLRRLTGRRLVDVLALQYAVVARPVPPR